MFSSYELSYYIISLGCSKNLVDSERVNGEMITAGFKSVESYEDADIIVINTCGFINDSKEESISTIFDAVDFKNEKSSKDGFKTSVVVMGCLTERYFENIKSEIEEIDFLYGIPNDKFVDDLAKKLNINISDPKGMREPLIKDLPYSYIKIAEGCSNNCSFCAIPLIRGKHLSFNKDFILNDARKSVKDGAKELIIIAQDIAMYSHSGLKLADIVEEVSLIDGVEWVRLLYCHPDHLTDEIISIYKNNSKVVRYIDIPFQHINKNILKSMNRRGDYETYISLIKKIRKTVPGIKIRSTFMVGYPGETSENYEELLSFLSEAKLDRVGAFTYSEEEDTVAAELDNMISEEIKIERYNKLMELQRDISIASLQSMIGETVSVIVEEKIDDNNYIGRTEFDAPDVDGIFYLTATEIELNTIVKATVTDSIEYDLLGELV